MSIPRGKLTVVLAALLAALLAGVVGTLTLGGIAAASPSLPFSDPGATGYIGLCNQAGRQITRGSIYTTPLAWRAVSSVAAPPPYNNDWRTAILLAYQPQQELTAEEWSGDELTASSRYSNPAHPMVAATGGDDSLEDFIEEFRPLWKGYLELRIYLGTQNAPTYSLHYPALAIQVTGTTWHAVGGGPVDCHSGSAVSLESIVLPRSATSLPTTTSTPPGTSATATALGSQRSATSKPSGASSSPDETVTIVLVLALIAAGSSLLLARRRRLALYQPIAGTSRRSNRKGH